jgi:hypothetical protein
VCLDGQGEEIQVEEITTNFGLLFLSRWIMDFYEEIQNEYILTDPAKSLERTWYYRDTDSMHIRIQCAEDLERWQPYLVKGKLGMMWHDLKDGEKVGGFFDFKFKMKLTESPNRSSKLFIWDQNVTFYST